MHVILFSRYADEVREFFRDVLELPSVDAGEGWPIFAAPPTELAVHPTEGSAAHEVYFMCDDVAKVVDQLAQHGIETAGPISDESWGRSTSVVLPGGESIGLYEPRHPSPLSA